MYWHIDTDIVSFIMLVALIIVDAKMCGKKKSVRNQRFTWCLLTGMFGIFVDVLSSIAMEFKFHEGLYHFLMSLYFIVVELAIIMWIQYAFALLYEQEEKKRNKLSNIIMIPFLSYIPVILSNYWTGWIFKLDTDLNYTRGKWFFLFVSVYFIYVVILVTFVMLRRRFLPKNYPTFILLSMPVLLSGSLAVQMLCPGLLLIWSGYVISMMIAFLFLQVTKLKEEDDLSEKLKIQQQFSDMIQYVPCGICLYHWDGADLTPLIVNPRFSEMLGEDAIEYLKNVKNLQYTHVHPADLEELKTASYIGLKQTGYVDCTYRSLNFRTSEYLWIHMRGTLLPDVDGQGRVLVSYNDVTAEHETEEKLKEKERQLIESEHEIEAKYELERKKAIRDEENLLVHSVINLTKGEVLEYNYRDGSVVPLENRDACIFCEQNTELLIDENEKEEFLKLNNSAFLLESFAKGETEFRMDYRRKLRTGYTNWVRCILHLVRDPRSNDVLLFEYWYDIEEEKMLESINQNITSEHYDFIIRIYAWNKHYIVYPKKGLTYHIPPLKGDNADKIGRYIFDGCVPEEDLEMAQRDLKVDQIRENLRKNDRYSFTYREKQVDESVRYKRITQYYIDAQREIIVIMREDITDLIVAETEKNQLLADALETANNANNAKSQFLSRVSHELRTPLNAIIGFMELSKDAEEAKVKKYLENSNIAAKQLLGIINDVLDMSSIESGKMKIAYAPFDFKHLLKSITNIYVNQCWDKGIQYETRMLTPVEEWLIGDPLRINQILNNLLGNAVKFTSSGHVWLSVSQRNVQNNKVCIHFEISDTGCGMNQEMENRLFQPFEQESVDTARKFGGSGLGLSIVKNLVNMMDGTIQVQSQLGEGSTFTIDLPLGRSAENEILGTLERAEDLHVLVLDDEESERDYVSTVLKRMGVRFRCEVNGTQAMQELFEAEQRKDPYNVCLVDWKMPDMNGIETTRKIRERYGKDVVVIIVSAYEHYQADESARQAGANLFISKPLFQSSLFDLFATLTGGRIAMKKETRKVDLKGKRVLLAEDNLMNRTVTEGIIQRFGLVCETVTNGKEAVERFETSTPGYFDVILMDIQMPVMDGMEATRAIRDSKHVDANNIYIIALTANAFNEDIAKSLSCGMNAHVSKPIDPELLASELEKGFREKEEREERDTRVERESKEEREEKEAQE